MARQQARGRAQVPFHQLPKTTTRDLDLQRYGLIGFMQTFNDVSMPEAGAHLADLNDQCCNLWHHLLTF